MINESDILHDVFSGTVAASVNRHFGLIGYDWVKDFIRDRTLREEMEALGAEIVEIGKAPIHIDELKGQFEKHVESLNRFRLRQLKSRLEEFQKNESPILMGERHLDGTKVLGSTFAPFFMSFSKKDMAFLFDGLPEGMSQEEKARETERCQARIRECQKIIDAELNPKSRWWFNEKGDPNPYPRGCRWTAFVNVWKKVAERFTKPVDINGLVPNPACQEAYGLLCLGKGKVSPLREPFTR